MPKGPGPAKAASGGRTVRFARRKEEGLAALVHQTIKVQEEERRRVATEIHDGVTQQLVSIWFRVHACQRLLERGEIPAAVSELATMKQAIDETL
ncbi:MAG TPA: histidine kinase, partial [Actinomycetota bacterium]|nr:histidine kinase [Actinomycetota bacterium]